MAMGCLHTRFGYVCVCVWHVFCSMQLIFFLRISLCFSEHFQVQDSCSCYQSLDTERERETGKSGKYFPLFSCHWEQQQLFEGLKEPTKFGVEFDKWLFILCSWCLLLLLFFIFPLHLFDRQ